MLLKNKKVSSFRLYPLHLYLKFMKINKPLFKDVQPLI